MSVIGNNTILGSFINLSGKTQFGGQFAVPSNGTITGLHAYMENTAAGTRTFRLLIYADDAGGARPGTLLHDSGAISLAASAGAAWVDDASSPAVSVSTGNVWLMIKNEGASAFVGGTRATTGGVSYTVADPSTGAGSNPCTTGGTAATSNWSIYADFSGVTYSETVNNGPIDVCANTITETYVAGLTYSETVHSGTVDILGATITESYSSGIGSTVIGKTGTSGTAVMQKSKAGWTYVAGKTGGTATAIAQKTVAGWSKVSGH